MARYPWICGAFQSATQQQGTYVWSMTEDQYRELVRANDAAQHSIAELATQMKLLVRLLNGAPDEDIPGVRPRLVMVERRMVAIPEDLPAQVKKLREDLDTERQFRTNMEQRWLGVKFALGGLGITSATLAATIVRLLFGGH